MAAARRPTVGRPFTHGGENTGRGMASLVAGGSGYFGQVLVERLRARGEQVAVFDQVDSTERPPDVTFHQGDIMDPAALRRACEGMEVVYHNIAQIALSRDTRQLYRINRDGTENILAAARAAGARKLVYTSTSAVFGVPARVPVPSDAVPVPQEDYGAAKYEGELRCRAYMDAGFDVAILRPCPIIGVGRLGIFHILFEWIREGRNVPVLGRGDNRFQFIHGGDFAEACILAGQRHGSGVYNCGAERFGSLRQVLEHLCRVAGTGSRVRGVPMGLAVLGMRVTTALGLSPLGAFHALMYGREFHFDLSHTKAELGWQPRFSNDEMLEESYRWYLDHREALNAQRDASAHRSPLRQGALSLLKYVL
jgi:nucleoside-diphosphate-sugar epimerase